MGPNWGIILPIIIIKCGILLAMLTIRTAETNEELICSFETEFNSYEVFYKLNDELFIVKKGFMREKVRTYSDKLFLDSSLERELIKSWTYFYKKGYYEKCDSIHKLQNNGQTPKEKIDYIKKDIIDDEKYQQRIILDKEKKLKLYLDLDCSK